MLWKFLGNLSRVTHYWSTEAASWSPNLVRGSHNNILKGLWHTFVQGSLKFNANLERAARDLHKGTNDHTHSSSIQLFTSKSLVISSSSSSSSYHVIGIKRHFVKDTTPTSNFGRQDIVKIRDASKVEKLLTEMVTGGSESLQVITDFDLTVTREHLNEEKCENLYEVLSNSAEMSHEFKDKVALLSGQYHPIYISQSMTHEEKIPFMVEWWSKAHELIVESGVKKEFLKQLVSSSKCLLRDNADELFRVLNDHDIPLLIFSAGIGDSLEVLLEENKIFYPNVKVMSNYMTFDSDTGKINGFKPPLIHTLNKNEAGLFEADKYFMNLTHRRNALVLGDNLADALMSDGMRKSNAIIKIGFLNDKVEERLDSFMDTWDIVLCDDQTMDFVNLILKNILKYSE